MAVVISDVWKDLERQWRVLRSGFASSRARAFEEETPCRDPQPIQDSSGKRLMRPDRPDGNPTGAVLYVHMIL